jgi:hypothetical protein
MWRTPGHAAQCQLNVPAWFRQCGHSTPGSNVTCHRAGLLSSYTPRLLTLEMVSIAHLQGVSQRVLLNEGRQPGSMGRMQFMIHLLLTFAHLPDVRSSASSSLRNGDYASQLRVNHWALTNLHAGENGVGILGREATYD